MSVVAVTSSRSSPGATSLAAGLALVWSHRFDRSVLIEADATGGVLSLRFDLAASPSLATFGSDVRNDYCHDALWTNTQDLRGACCLTAPVDPRLAQAWVERVTPILVERLPTLGAPAVIDLGWIGEDGTSLGLCAAADVTLIVTRPEIAEIQALLFQIRRLQAAGANLALVTVGSTPNDPREVARLTGIPLAAVLPDEAVVAKALSGHRFAPNKLRRSLLWRTIGALADTLVDPAVMAERAELVEPGANENMVPSAPVPSAPVAVAPAEATVETFAQLRAQNGHRSLLELDHPTTIGRHSANGIAIRDTRVSRHHGAVQRHGADWYYRDLGSSNGSQINGQRCGHALLRSGDELTVGRTRLVFELIRASTLASYTDPPPTNPPTYPPVALSPTRDPEIPNPEIPNPEMECA